MSEATRGPNEARRLSIPLGLGRDPDVRMAMGRRSVTAGRPDPASGRRDPATRRRDPASGIASESGFTLIGLLVLVLIINVSLAVAATSWVTLDRRADEAELLWRGQQYVRAIECHQREEGGLPQQLDDLVDSDCIRRLWPDPMVDDGEWRVVRASDLAELLGGATGQGGPGAGGRPSAGAGSTLGAGRFFGAGGSSLGGSGLSAGGGPTGGGSRLGGGPTGGGSRLGGAAGQPSGPRGSPGGLAPVPLQGQDPSDVSSAVQRLRSALGQSLRRGQASTGDGIVGVVSRSQRDSLRLYGGAQRYSEWLFVVDNAAF